MVAVEEHRIPEAVSVSGPDGERGGDGLGAVEEPGGGFRASHPRTAGAHRRQQPLRRAHQGVLPLLVRARTAVEIGKALTATGATPTIRLFFGFVEPTADRLVVLAEGRGRKVGLACSGIGPVVQTQHGAGQGESALGRVGDLDEQTL